MHTDKTHIETLSANLFFEMIHVEGGSFMMGSDDKDADDDEKPIHKVTVPSFYLAKYPVTQAVWKAVMGENPSDFKGEDRPVENVFWNDAQDFIKKLNKVTGKTYRLPTEAEWEFAARGGIHSEGYLYAGSDKLKEVGWYRENSDDQTHSVGQKLGNELDLYDMSGNVWEWVEDEWHKNYDDGPTDGSAWIDDVRSSRRVYRGGSWIYYSEDCRVSIRGRNSLGLRTGSLGFRLALSFQSVG